MNRNARPKLIGRECAVSLPGYTFWLAIWVLPHLTIAQTMAQEVPPPALQQQPALHQQIDQLLSPADAALPHADVAESLLVRRVYLDLIGVPPSLPQLLAYQADPSADKYPKLVERLLQSPEFVEHWVKQLDLMFMERRGNTHVPQVDWEEYLRKSLSAQQPFNQLCSEILSASGAPGTARPAGRFYLDRGGDIHLITRDVGRVFFGRDLQCAQCHDHPLIDSYFQSDFHGISAFFSGGYMVEVAEGDKKLQVYAEKSLLESPYESVFHKGAVHRTLPRIPGTAEVIPPSVQPGADYEVAPADGVAAKPKYSRRLQLAQLATSGTSRAFNENWANRFWALLFGRGIIHPSDLIHADAEPLHPDLLSLLGQRFAESNFNLRFLLSEFVQTKLYRSGQSEPFDGTASPRAKEIVHKIDWNKILSDRQSRLDSTKAELAALREKTNTAKNSLLAIEQERTALLTALDQTRAALIGANDAQNKAAAEVATAEKNLADEQAKQAKLQVASAAADEVKGLIQQDADIAKAAEILQQKLASLATSAMNLSNMAEEKRKTLAAAQSVTETHKVAWAAADKAVSDKGSAYHQADLIYLEARNLEEQARLRSGSLKRDVDYAKAVIAVRDGLAEIDTKVAELAQFAAQRDSLVSQKNIYSTNLAQLEPQLTQATRDRDQAQEVMKAQQQRLQDTEGKHQLIVAAQAALQKIPDNQVDSLRTAMEELQRRSADSEKNLVAQRQEMQNQQSILTTVQTKLAELQTAQMNEAMGIAKTDMALASMETMLQQADQARAAANEKYMRQIQELRKLRTERFEYAKLVALTPEQMAWSFLSCMGFLERQIAAKLAELDKSTPLTAEQQQDANLVQQRNLQAYLQARKDLQGNVNIFVSLYGAGAGQPQGDFFATADQALFANNGGTLFSWAGSAGDNVTSKLIAATDLPAAIDHLYLALLGRTPTAEEIADVQQYLSQAPDQKAALAQELVWGILTSAEFRFNH